MLEKQGARKLLNYKHISNGVDSTLSFIQRRRMGEEPSLVTSFNKLNEALLDGIDWYRILSIGGMSGSGKSTLLELLKRDFVKLNDNNFDILSFEFEMRIEDQLTRNAASQTGIGVKEIYSANGILLDDTDYTNIARKLEEIKSAPIYYVDNVGTVEEIVDTIRDFVDRKSAKTGRGIVVTIDHVLLTKGRQGQEEKSKIDALMHSLIALKKEFSSRGIKCIFIALTQLNRDIQSGDRVMNKNLHYPTSNDLFAASSVYQCSDYVLITHKPARVRGIGEWYGPGDVLPNYPQGLPVWCPTDDTKAMVYWHLIKERFGEEIVIPMVEDFAVATITQYEL